MFCVNRFYVVYNYLVEKINISRFSNKYLHTQVHCCIIYNPRDGSNPNVLWEMNG